MSRRSAASFLAFRRTWFTVGVGVLALAAVVVGAPTVRAADGTPDTDAGSHENEASADAGPQLVVVADVARNATENSQLRAALYEVARRHGYTPAGKLDIEGVASRESLMAAGSITTDPAELGRLRVALGVAILVRVSKDADHDGATRLVVVAKRGVEAQTVQSTTAEPLEAALDQLLPHSFSGETTKTNPEQQPTSERLTAPTLVLDRATTSEHDLTPREAWDKRGGFRPMYGAVAVISATEIRHVGFTVASPTGGTVSGSATATGVGGGFGVRAGFIYLPVPDPKLSEGGFVAFRLGIGVDMNVLWLDTPKGYSYDGANRRSVAYASEALWVANAPAELGFAIAAGHFAGDSVWRGALIGFAYAPAAQFSMNLANTSGAFRVNPAGAQVSVDITRLDASRGDDAEMQIRVLLSGLAPLDDAHPGMVSLGIGAIWY